MQLSVIILNYNVRYFLELCILSVQKALQEIDGEIIVVDNASSDGSCEMIKEHFPDIKLIENKENSGFPKGNNIGVDQAKGKYICILNPDTIVAEDTFTKILSHLDKTPPLGIGGIGCKLIDGTGAFLPESKRGIPTPWVAFTKVSGLYKIFPKVKIFNQYYAQHIDKNQSGKVDILVGAFMVMKRDLYQKLSGFDENCFMYSDDIDLSYRILQEGLKNYYFHETSVVHFKGESTVRDKVYLNRFRDAMEYFYGKHFKKSWFFFAFMSVGSYVFSFLKVMKGKAKPKSIPDKILVITNQKERFELIKRKTQQKTEVVYVENSIDNILKKTDRFHNIQLILDLGSISYKQAIQLMETGNNKNLSYRFLHPELYYWLGSDDKDGRGEVSIFND